MGRRGPAPTPTALKIAKGNPGKRKISTKEPTPDVESPECPQWLSRVAKVEWERVVPLLIKEKVLSKLDLAALAGYCQSYANWRAAEEELRKGTTYESGPTDKLRKYPKPELKISQDERRLMHKFLTEFGLTPSSRTRVQIDKPKPGDDFAAFRASRPA